MNMENDGLNISPEDLAKYRERYQAKVDEKLKLRHLGFPTEWLFYGWLIFTLFVVLPFGTYVYPMHINPVYSTYSKTYEGILGISLLLWVGLLFIVFGLMRMENQTTLRACLFFPRVVFTAFRLNETGSRFIPLFQELVIDGQSYFILFYVTRTLYEWLDMSGGGITGVAMINRRGEVIDNVDLLRKAWLPLTLAQYMRYHVRLTEAKEYRDIKYNLRNFNGFRKALNKKAVVRVIEENGLSEQRLFLLQKIDFMVEAQNDMLKMLKLRDRWRHALGYEFGKKFSYADGLSFQESCRVFSAHMAANYIPGFIEINQKIDEIRKMRKQKNLTILNQLGIYFIYSSSAFDKMGDWIETYNQFAAPTDRELMGYRRKVNRAYQLNLRVTVR